MKRGVREMGEEEPGRRKRSRMPDSESQWVEMPEERGEEEELRWVTSIQVSEAVRWKTPTEDLEEWPWRRGTAP